MRPSIFHFPLFLLVSAIPVSLCSAGTLLESGHWQLSQDGSRNAWALELIDDGGSHIMAVGKRFESDGKRIVDRSIAFLHIERYRTGELGGSFIETFGGGEKEEIGVAIQTHDEGSRLDLVAMNEEGTVIATFSARWMGRGVTAGFQSGNWVVREITMPGNGSWDIEWNFKIDESDGRIKGSGNKAIVNRRKAYPGERRTVSRIEISRKPEQPDAVEGSGVETNHVGQRMRATYVGWVSPSGRTLLLRAYSREKLVAMLTGRFKGR